jgi:hypothetical protein
MFKLKNEAELTAMTPEQRDAYAVSKQTFEAEEVTKRVAEEVAKEVAKITDVQKVQLETLALELKAMKENPVTETSKREVELKETVGKISEIVKGGNASANVVVKALLLRAGIANNEQAVDLMDIGQLAHRRLSAYDIFPKIKVSESNNNGIIRYYDWDTATSVRAAASIAEGAAFPESTATFAKGNVTIEKIGDTLPVTEEFFEDEAMFASELEFFLMTNVDLIVDNQIINGDGTSNQLDGLVNRATAYTAAASGISDASIYDLIVKLKEDISATGGSKYQPDFAVMNIVDINKMKLKKDANENYVMPPFVDRAGNVVDGITIVECNAVTANTMVLGDSRFAKIYEKTGVEVSKGMVNAQFVEDEMTLKVRRRIAFLIRNADQAGFKKVASISADLVTLAS